MADKLAITVQSSTTQTTAGSSAGIDLSSTIGATRNFARLVLDVTAISGTGATLTVTVESSPDGLTGWRSAGAFTAVTAVSRLVASFAVLEQFVRVSWAFTGTTPSATFSVSGDADVIYATPDDLSRYAINANAIASVSSAVLSDCCLRATDDAETALNSAYTLPLTKWGQDLRGHVASRAAFYAMVQRGFKPSVQNQDNMIIMSGGFRTPAGVKSAAQEFFDSVASGGLKPIGIIDQTTSTFEAAEAVVESAAPRGWV